MYRPENVRAAIDSLHGNVAVLDGRGEIIEVNEGWRRFGRQRNAASDYVGLNYFQVCERAADSGNAAAMRVAVGLRRLMEGRADSYSIAYRCAESTFRLKAHRFAEPSGRLIVAHQDITRLLTARRERHESKRQLQEAQRAHAARVELAYEEIGQALTAISLATRSLSIGGNVPDAVTTLKMSVENSWRELKLLRSDTPSAPR